MIRLVFASCLVTSIVAHGPPFDLHLHSNWHLLDTTAVCGRSPVLKSSTDNNIAFRLINGKTADEHEFPWMAQLMLRNIQKEPVCGGSLINNRYVLTAAHCVTYNASKNTMPAIEFSVRLGAHRVLNDCDGRDSCQEFNVEKIITHGNYNFNFSNAHLEYMKNDVALMRLYEDVQFITGVISPICLPASKGMNDKWFSGQPTIVAAFGQNNDGFANGEANAKYPQALQKTDAHIVHPYPPNRCELTHYDLPSQICIRLYNKAIAKGDSGSPLIYKHFTKKVYYQLGIVSYGDYVNGPNLHNQYTICARVTSYMAWILDQVEP